MSYNFNNMNSSFWLGDEGVSNLSERSSVSKLVELSKYHKAIKNFVSILTEQDIPVEFHGDDSYTDGKRITITSNIKHSEFDAVVGLALHEGSHIKLSDFDGLKKIMNGTHPKVQKIQDVDLGLLKNILNIVEDRRIDNYVMTTCPGYVGYYQSLYDKYFHAKIIDKALQSSEHRTETVDSYMFRLCNITNANRDLKALKGLQDIWNVLDLRNIGRLKTSEDALDVSIDIYNIIMDNIDKSQQQEQQGQGQSQQGSGNSSNEQQEGGSQQQDNEDSDDDGSGSSVSDDGDVENDGSQGYDSGEGDEESDEEGDEDSNFNELSDRQKKQLEKAISNQKEFLDHNIKKKKMSKSDKNKMTALTKSGVEGGEVGNDHMTTGYGSPVAGSVPSKVIKNYTMSMIDNGLFPDLARKTYNGDGPTKQSVIDKGLQMGTMLGKKMRTRQEQNQLETTRLKSGKIDKRLLSGVGYGVTEVFKKVDIQNFKPAYIHISIDASGSMWGEKWDNSITTAVAIAKAASMLQGVECTISTRGDDPTGPVTLIAYDSKKDKINKVKTMFKYLNNDSTTPEGLSFESIQKYIEESNNGQDSYFINISDGAPYYSSGKLNYSGKHAYSHTKKQINKMRDKGVKILSYFVYSGSTPSSYTKEAFNTMYGKDAETIDMTNVGQIARTMNKLLMKK